MGIGGLIARAALLKEQMKRKPCKRCKLHYNHKKLTDCPHCGDLTEKGLEELFANKEEHYQSRKTLGMIFFILALITVFLMALVAVSK